MGYRVPPPPKPLVITGPLNKPTVVTPSVWCLDCRRFVAANHHGHPGPREENIAYAWEQAIDEDAMREVDAYLEGRA